MKKGFFFLLDGVFAIMILMIGYLLITSNRTSEATEIPLSMQSENALDLLSSVKVNEICDVTPPTCSCTNPTLDSYCPVLILNFEQTLLDYFGELYYRGTSPYSLANSLFRSLIYDNDLVRANNIEFIINNERIYASPNADITKAESKELISSKKVIFGYYENAYTGVVVFWGPYLVEVNVWQ